VTVANAVNDIKHDYSEIFNKQYNKHHNIMQWQVKYHIKVLNSQSKRLNKAANDKEEEYQNWRRM